MTLLVAAAILAQQILVMLDKQTIAHAVRLLLIQSVLVVDERLELAATRVRAARRGAQIVLARRQTIRMVGFRACGH